MRAALFVHVVQRCISAGLVGHACEDSNQESVMSEMPKAPPLATHTVRTPRQSTSSRVPLTPHGPFLLGKVADVASSKTNPPGRTRTRALAAQV